MHLPKARPPEGDFKCSGYKFTSLPQMGTRRHFIKALPRISLRVFFTFHETDKKNTTPKQNLKINQQKK